jgi:glycosyltransferase involved in cell wall biosynthesis
MNNKPLVTVLVATYNQESVVEQALRSIQTQSYTELEILVSDDCSSDRTRQVIERVAREDSRFRCFFQEKNLGITSNYNFLASRASGEFVSIFAGDDIMMPEKIEKQIKRLVLDSCASFCHHAVELLDGDSGTSLGVLTHKYVNDVTTINDVLRNLGVPGSMSILYRKSSAESPVFDPRIGTASDWLQIIHLSAAGKGVYIDEPLCYYRKASEYNGKDPSRYEGDFTTTIAIVRDRYATADSVIASSCDYALARYYLGAAYRRLQRGDVLQAREQLRFPLRELKLFPAALFLMLISLLPHSFVDFAALKRGIKKLWG